MRTCETCGVTIENKLVHCPLCKGELTDCGGGFEIDFPAAPQLEQKRGQARILIFCMAVLVTASVLVDVLTSSPAHWSYIAAGGLVYLLLSAHFIRKSRRNIGMLAIIQIFGVSILSFAVDAVTGYYRWSTNYVIPFVVISAAGLMTVVLLARPHRFRDYILYQLAISVIGVGVSIHGMLDPNAVLWTGVVGIAYSLLTILGVLLFSARKTKHELRKRFHF